jgi:predicted  nucleic acid-binding Zn-ribbon protein
MPHSKPLQELQTIDLQAARADARLARVRAALADEGAPRRAQREAAEAQAALERHERELKALQDERSALKARIATEEGRLYGGTGQAPKELQGLQREVESLRRRLGQLDDRALEAMLAADEARARAAAATAAASSAQQAADRNAAALRAEQDKLTAALAQLARLRERQLPAVPAADLALYERLRRKIGVPVLAVVTGGNCGACGIVLPRHQLDDLLDGGPSQTCGHCGRILVS